MKLSSMRRPLILALHGATYAVLGIGLSGGCSDGADSVGEAKSAQVSDAQSITRRPDGLFDVVCRDGRQEVANETEILANTVCAPPLPWDSGSQTGDAGPGDSGSSEDASQASTVFQVSGLIRQSEEWPYQYWLP